ARGADDRHEGAGVTKRTRFLPYPAVEWDRQVFDDDQHLAARKHVAGYLLCVRVHCFFLKGPRSNTDRRCLPAPQRELMSTVRAALRASCLARPFVSTTRSKSLRSACSFVISSSVILGSCEYANPRFWPMSCSGFTEAS